MGNSEQLPQRLQTSLRASDTFPDSCLFYIKVSFAFFLLQFLQLTVCCHRLFCLGLTICATIFQSEARVFKTI